MALKNAKIITVTSVKGGTGKSTILLNIAGELKTRNKKVLIMDLDLYTGCIATMLKVDAGVNIFNFVADLMSNTYKQVEDYIKKYDENIDVLPAPRDPRSVGKIDVKYIDLIIKKLIHLYDYILIDTNHTTDLVKLISMDLSEYILYVMTGDIMDIKNMKTMISIFKDMEKTNYKIILNTPISISSYNKYDIRSIIGVDPDYVIPKKLYNKTIEKQIIDGKIPVIDNKIIIPKIVDDLSR